VFRSPDGGMTWTSAKNGLSADFAVGSLVVDPTTPSVVYAGQSSGAPRDRPAAALFRSTDGARSWAPASAGLPPRAAVEALAIDANRPSTLYAAVLRFTDEGGLGEGVYRSADGGEHWEQSSLTDYYIVGLTVDRDRPGTVFGHTVGVIFHSEDGGDSWQMISGCCGGPVTQDVALSPDAGGIVYVATTAGAFRSPDGGEHWEPFATSISSTRIDALAVHASAPRNAYARTDDYRLSRTIDGGRRWLDIGFTSIAPVIDPDAPATLYVARGGTLVERSDDGGDTWQSSGAGLPVQGVVTQLAFDRVARVVYAAVAFGSPPLVPVFSSDDDGGTWRRSGRQIAAEFLTIFVAHPSVGGLLYAGDSTALWRREDGVQNWQRLDATPGGSAFDLAVSAREPGLVYYAAGGALYRSADRGDSWVTIPVPGSVASVAIDPGDPRTVYVGLFRGGALLSDDDGATWTPLGAGLPLDVPVNAVAVDERFPARLYAATDGAGVFTLIRSDRLPCAADCDDSGQVGVEELVSAVRIGLGEGTLAQCASADTDDDGSAAIDDLIRAVRAALFGC
jgi:photosystem II stability/assembly factor-like uncharacterized protein